MTSRERFLKTINGEVTDRVPVTLFICDQGHFISQVYPDIDPLDYSALQLKVIEIQKQLGCDVFVRMLFDVNDPLHIHMGGLDITQQTENWEVSTEDIYNGNTLIKKSLIKTPAGTLEQEFSINELRKGTFMYGCTKKPIHNLKDLEIAIKYEPRMPAAYKEKTKQKVKKIKDKLGDDGILGVWAPHGPFNNSSLLIPHDELYSLFLEDYEYYEKLMDFAMERILDYTAAMDEAGADVLCVGGNVPGGFLGKRIYDEYILPFEKKYIEICQKNGTPAMYHNCGQIMNLVDSYKDLGVRIVEPFSPPPLGDTDLEKAKQMVNGDYVMLVGIDQVNVLQNGTIDEIKRVTEKTVNIAKPGGKTIIQSADFLEYGTPLENLEAYVKTAKEFGGY
jgi:uroporphyrinogen decarboxylase